MLWVLKLRIKLLYRRQRQAQLMFCLVKQHISFFSESRSMVAFVCFLSAFLTIIASLLCYTCDNQACSRYTCQPAETSPMGLQSYHEIGTIRCQPLGRRANTNVLSINRVACCDAVSCTTGLCAIIGCLVSQPSIVHLNRGARLWCL